MLMTYVNLNRNFNEIPTHLNDDIDLSDIYSEGFGKDENWEDILLKNRVIILAEAGSGKTVEIKNKSEELSLEGKSAFFIRLEDIKNNFENAFDHGDIELFNRWLNSSEEAYFFLDSVDEAKLSDVRDFKRAVQVFSSKLKSGSNRAKIFITSRGSVWKPKTDLDMVNDLLKLPNGNDESFEVFSLSTLNISQIKLFADANNVEDSETLIQEIIRQEAEVFTKRPLDLQGIIDYWNTENKIGSRKELLDNSISKYLGDVEEGRDKCDVAYDKLLSGAKEIAAALTFCRKSKIAIPDKKTDQDSLQLKTILGGWTNDEISTLLSRPVFEPSIYGSQRFTQRLLREYLTALWVHEKVKSGNLDKDRLREIFFRNIYGIEVPILSLKAVLSWYVLLDREFAKIVEELRPEIFMDGGDPSGLTVEHRISLLRSFCLMYKEKNSCFITFDSSALLRFGSSAMEGTVLELLYEYYDNRPIMQILLQMATTYKMKSCSEIALKISLDDSCETVSRKLAIKLIKDILSPRQIRQNVKDVKDKYNSESNELARIIIDEYSDYLSVDEVINILSKVPKPSSFGFSSIELTAENYINSLPEASLLTAIRRLYELVDSKPYKEGYRSEISEKYKWLVKVLEIGLERYLESKEDILITTELLTFISKIQNKNEMKNGSDRNGNLFKVVQEWRNLNYEVFWNNVENERLRKSGRPHADASNSTLTYWYQASWMRSLWSFSHSDLFTVLEWIGSKKLNDDRLVAISLAWKLIEENGRIESELDNFITLASFVDGGVEMVNSFINPVKPHWQLEDESRQAKYLIEREEEERKDQENLAESKGYISRNKNVITDIQHAKNGEFNGVQQYLLHKVGEANENNHSWSLSNWKSLATDFGEETASLYKDASIAYWKEFNAPLLLSEGGCEHYDSFIMAISGVFIENELDSEWSRKINQEEAIKAIKLAICEMNGLPVWFEGLYSSFPTEVVGIFVGEIEWLYANQKAKTTNGYVLGQVLNNEEYLIEDISRPIYEQLSVTKVTNYEILKKSLCILSKSENITDVELVDLAKVELNITSKWGAISKFVKKFLFIKSKPKKFSDEIAVVEKDKVIPETSSLWWAILISSDADTGLRLLKKHLASLVQEKPTELAIAIVSELSDKGYDDVLTERTSHNTVSSRLSLYKLMHQYIREEDDINRSDGGCYCPTNRDNAQDSRNKVFNLMCETSGEESYLALVEIASMWEHIPFRNIRINHLAVERAEKDAEFDPFSELGFVEFSKSLNEHNNGTTINNHINFGTGNKISNSPVIQNSSGTTTK